MPHPPLPPTRRTSRAHPLRRALAIALAAPLLLAGCTEFIDAGVDVLNLQQPQAYGIAEIGRKFAGKVCFLTTADIQQTLPSGDADRVRTEVRELVEHWSTPDGGFIVFNYGKPESLAVPPEMTEVMFRAFLESSPEKDTA